MIRIKNPNPPRLPREYQEVEYIEGTGTQYIKSGIMTSNSLRVEAKAISRKRHIYAAPDRNYPYSGILFGARVSPTSNNFTYNEGAYSTYVGNGTSQQLILPFQENSTDYLFVNYGGTSYSVECGNTYNQSGALNINIETPLEIYILGLNQNGTVSSPCGAYKLFNLKIYNNNTVVRDYIPCYRKADNEAGLFDLVNNVFYTNAGTGTFLIGKEINRKEDINLKPMIGNKKLIKRYVNGNLIYGQTSPKYEQKINYTMLYDNGNECEEVIETPSSGDTEVRK